MNLRHLPNPETSQKQIEKASLFYAPSNHPEVTHTYIKYDRRKLPREFIEQLVNCNDLPNYWSCGLFCYAWLCCHARSFYKKDEKQEPYPTVVSNIDELMHVLHLSRPSVSKQLNILQSKNLIQYSKIRINAQGVPVSSNSTRVVIHILWKSTAITGLKRVSKEIRTLRDGRGFVFFSLYNDIRRSFYGDKLSCMDLAVMLYLNAVFGEPGMTFPVGAAVCVWHNSRRFPIKHPKAHCGHFSWCSSFLEIGKRIHQSRDITKKYLMLLEKNDILTIYQFYNKGVVIFLNHYAKQVYPWSYAKKVIHDNIPNRETISQLAFGIDPDKRSRHLSNKIFSETIRLERQRELCAQTNCSILTKRKELDMLLEKGTSSDILQKVKKDITLLNVSLNNIFSEIRTTVVERAQNQYEYLCRKGKESKITPNIDENKCLEQINLIYWITHRYVKLSILNGNLLLSPPARAS